MSVMSKIRLGILVQKGGKVMLDGMIIRVACKVKNLQTAIDKAWTQAEAKKYPHA